MARPTMNWRLWGGVLVVALALLVFWLIGATAMHAQTVPTYTTQLLTTPDSIGLEVSWVRDASMPLSWGHVQLCPGGDPGVIQGCDHRPKFRDSTFAATGTTQSWYSLAGLAGKTVTMSACIQTQYGSVARNTYPCPKVAHTYIVPPTAPPRPPPMFAHWRHDTTFAGGPIELVILQSGLRCPITIEYDETPTTPLYTIRAGAGAAAACAAPIAAMNAEWSR